MKKIKYISLMLLSFISLTLFAACSPKSSGIGTLNFSFETGLESLDSSVAYDSSSFSILANVEEGLTRMDGDKPVLALAKSIKVSDDGLTYTISLKPDLKWSNGDKLTAKDFVYAWQRGVNPKTKSEYAYLFDNLKNGEAVQKGELPAGSLGVRALGEDKLLVILATPTPYFEQLLQEPIYFPLNQKFVEKVGKSYGTSSDKTVYNGAYKFSTQKGWNGTNNSFSIVKNNNYYAASKVKTNKVNYQITTNVNTALSLYKSKKLDMVNLSTPELVKANKNRKDFKVLANPSTDYVQYNVVKVKALRNEKIRQALNLATNRKEIVSIAAPYAKTATGVTPYGLSDVEGRDFSEYAAQPYRYNPEEAKKVWEEGLKELGLTKLNLTIEGNGEEDYSRKTLAYLQTSLQNTLPNLTVTQRAVPQQQRLKDSLNGNFEIMLSSVSADYAEPSFFLNIFLTNGAFNSGKFSNAEVDNNYKKASSLPDVMSLTKRSEDYRAMEQAMYEQSNINPIDFKSSPVLINPDIKGLDSATSITVTHLRNAYLK